ncbi:hypothetical protein PVT68_05660 [Microbulbifer bruguierae]|uniref:MYXO-CTERM domain-containing protein n=1 Tax=Microbulbifer bruguierae TaxID=3029061 RepID=A0ABY8NH51_9GAMM|nr:hypothetical protein [Microbulbifer bruguierae]WGL17780.1 hypothetical protein PVT68_05660 [Microbulbifer bruguierae]
MKKYVYASLAVLMLSSPLALADGGNGGKHRDIVGSHDSYKQHDGNKHNGGAKSASRHGSSPSGKYDGDKKMHAAPEIDVAGAGIAFALLAGLVAVRRERRASKKC